MKDKETLFPAGYCPNPSWAFDEFGHLRLGDARRTGRLVKSFQKMLERPGDSIPEATGNWADAKAFYRLLDCEELTGEALLEAHRQGTLRRAGQSGQQVFLAVQDTTSVNFTSHKALEDQGPIGKGQRSTGLHLHNTLLIGAEGGEVFGLLGAEFYARDGGKRSAQTPGTRNREPIEQKESHRWLKSFDLARQAREALEDKKAGASGEPAEAGLVVSVGDREADIYELLAEAQKCREQGVGLLVRSQHNRQLERDREGEERRLWEALDTIEEQGRLEVSLPRSQGLRQREVTLALRYQRVRLEAPAHKRKYLDLTEPLNLTIIDLRERGSGNDTNGSAIHWRLITTLEVDSPARAEQIARWYALRWQVEVLHRILKTGCRVERRQLRTMARLEPVIALDLVVAAFLLSVVSASRQEPARPALHWFDLEELTALVRYLKLKDTEPENLTLERAVALIGRLGGHLGRKGDGPPGPEVLWRGIQKLQVITVAWLSFSTPL